MCVCARLTILIRGNGDRQTEKQTLLNIVSPPVATRRHCCCGLLVHKQTDKHVDTGTERNREVQRETERKRKRNRETEKDREREKGERKREIKGRKRSRQTDKLEALSLKRYPSHLILLLSDGEAFLLY